MTDSQVLRFLLALAFVVVLARLAGRVARRLGQPEVIGEMAVGILIGPTLLHGRVGDLLFPAAVRPFLTAVADLGLVVFMFVVGLELDHRTVRTVGRATAGAAAGATLLPLGLGALLGLYLAPRHAAGHETGFVLFMAVAMSVTAFPVLARIIGDRGLGGTPLGTVALSTAAVCDVVAWTLLAAVQAAVGGAAAWQIALTVPYAAVMLLVVRPLLERSRLTGALAARSPAALAAVLTCLLLSASATQALGLHFIFGAFLFGLVLPRGERDEARGALLHGLQFGTVLLLPAYFVLVGLKVDLARTSGRDLLDLGLILATAVAAKFGGAFLGARAQGLPARMSALLAVLMNTRGLTELVALGVGLGLGVLDRGLYGLMVVMALATTAMTGPALKLLGVDRYGRETLADDRPEPAATAASGEPG
ncbi:cation:proton antiporter domain-containing protein [Actinomadura rupiterrae]|uniref:cation:proton antiporter domain-containing protein n=1 Tax=Actinomadura rupiterrae TaxID=559627 RepID=UPI0020A2B338|nr:cation:proton antiporter [Actinomadura rupiterrae]MCP2336099.1 Kef-type K+ transport system membrane component KefB [Actinomadura rupiterrae]